MGKYNIVTEPPEKSGGSSGVSGSEPVMYPKKDGANRKTYIIKAENWDKNLPYYFAVLKANPNTQSVLTVNDKETGFQDFILPINPENINISIPFAINLSATTRGILEEHNGTIFRNISIKGTTGVSPGNFRSGGFSKPASKGGLGDAASRGAVALAANALNAAGNTLQAFQRSLQSATATLPKLESGVDVELNKWKLGHAQLHLLLNYFVAYSEHKKKSKNKLARLVFVSLKDGTAYIVTPLNFAITKSADRPHQFDYNITLRAWDMVENWTDSTKLRTRNPFALTPLSNNPNLLSRMVNTVREARSTISSSRSAIKAVASDLESAFDIVSETLLLVKEIAGLARDAADFPKMIKNRWKDLSSEINEQLDDIKEEWSGKPSSSRQKNILTSINGLMVPALATKTEADPTNPKGVPIIGQTREQQIGAQQKLDIENPFNTTGAVIDHIDLLSLFQLDEFIFNDAEQDEIDDEVRRLQSLTILDFDKKKKKIEDIRDAFADSRNLGDADYNSAVGRSEISGFRRTPTSSDFLILKAFNDLISALDALSATNELVRDNIPDPFIRAQEIVSDSDISIARANSAFPVPFPFRGTLEKLASLYLDSPDRWIEIAILNNLKPPYIDEDGFIRSFSTSGNNNSFTISDASDLFLDQEVFISSASQKQEKRRIVDIDEIDVNNFLITLDGNDDLSRFTVAQAAKVKAYLPNTINSSKIILIPLPGELPENDNIPDTREIPSSKNLSEQERLMGIDIELTEDFDLAITSIGDAKIANGFRNAIQAVRLKLAIERGQLKQHQEYGAGLPIGERNEFTTEDIKAFLEEAISRDPRFESLPDIVVELDGPTVKLNLRVKVVENGGIIPITFRL